MNTLTKLGILGGVFGLLGILIIAAMVFVSYSNGEIRLRNQVGAQQESCKVVQDNTWKIISQKAQVKDSYKDAFLKVYPDIMKERHANGGALMKFVTEANPNFDISLYKDLSASIEALRTTFTREQNKLIDLKREHDNMIQTFPGSFILASRPEIKIQIITSAKTKETYATGEENDIKL